MVQTRSGAGQSAEIQESLRVSRRIHLISLALSVVCLFCSTYCAIISTYCAIYIRKSVEESSESFGELSFFRESFTKEMKESNSSLRESLQNLTRTVAEFYHFFVKEIQEIKASQFKIINLTKNFSIRVIGVKHLTEFSDSLSAKFTSVFARLKKRLVADIQLFYEWMYHEKYKLFAAAQYILTLFIVAFVYKKIYRGVQRRNARGQPENACGRRRNARGRRRDEFGRFY